MGSRKNRVGNLISEDAAISPGATRAQRRARKQGKRRRAGDDAGENKGRSVEIPVPLHAAIEKERGRLLRADAVLGCLVIAMEFDSETNATELPSYPYVAQIARDLVSQTIDALDLVELQRQASRYRVKEGVCLLTLVSPAPAPSTIEWPIKHQPVLPRARDVGRRTPGRIHLHRRNYAGRTPLAAG